MTISIVIVDDDETDRYIVKRVVEKLEYKTRLIEFEDGDQFLDVVKDSKTRAETLGVPPPPIIVLLDINMPRMNGFEVLESLQGDLKIGDQLFIVTMYSSSNHAEDKSDSKKYEFVKDYIVKPITVERLDELVQQFIP